MSHNLTIGDVLPSNLKSDYSSEVLDTSLDEAIGIATFDKPSRLGLVSSDISAIKQIYSKYLNKGDDESSDSSYWNKSKSDNEAYWNS